MLNGPGDFIVGGKAGLHEREFMEFGITRAGNTWFSRSISSRRTVLRALVFLRYELVSTFGSDCRDSPLCRRL